MPLLSIVDATAQAIRNAGLRSVGLLGTAFTMRERFFCDGLNRRGIEVLVPERDDQDRIHDIIYRELCRGEVLPQSRALFVSVVEKLQRHGAQGIVLGCTEIPLSLRPEDCELPLFNTTVLHAEQALEYAVQRPQNT